MLQFTSDSNRKEYLLSSTEKSLELYAVKYFVASRFAPFYLLLGVTLNVS